MTEGQNNTDQVNNTSESDITPIDDTTAKINNCNNPLTIETISCIKHTTSYTGTFSYITASTDIEKTDCIYKYSLRMEGCTYRFIAPWPDNRTPSLCESATDICSNTKTVWQNELISLGYQCSHTTQLINEGLQYGGALSPYTPNDCPETNSFQPFMD